MKFSITLFLALISTAKAATIAVIDSGVDYRHQQLAAKMWLNPMIRYDGDFPRTINGWNFVDKNNSIFNYSLLSTYPSDIHRFFVAEANYNSGTLTADDRKYLVEKTVDANYMAKVSSFGSYAHGTHVAGIATKDASHEIIGMTYIATRVASVLNELNSMKANFSDTDKKFHSYLAYLASDQAGKFKELLVFLDTHTADVANGSFGASFKQVQRMTDIVFKEVYQRDPSEKESFSGAYILQHFVIKNYQKSLAANTNTLFVFAAGNDGMNNDIYPFTPANVGMDNSISVAATNGTSSIANFSNYGVKTVDVAAPGVNILSASPGINAMPMSGTSQAAPLVSRIAGKIKDINSRLTPAQVKEILMGTVDKKAFLKKLVKSGGIVNESRALRASELSRSLSLNKAIYQAGREISQSNKSLIKEKVSQVELRHVELPALFID